MDRFSSVQKSPQLTPEQKRRMEENRKRALEKLQQKQQAQLPHQNSLHRTQTSPSVPSICKDSKSSYNSSASAASSLIEANRQRALEKLMKKHPDSAIMTGSPKATKNVGYHRPSPSRPLDTAAGKGVASIEEKKLKALQKLKAKQATQTTSIERTALQSTSTAYLQSSHTSNNDAAANQNWAEKFGYQPSTKKSYGMMNASPSKGARLISKINRDNCNEIGFRIKDTDVKRTDLMKAKPISGKPFEVNMILMNPRRFEAKCLYNTDVIGIFKTMDTKSYDQKSKTWNFGIMEHEKLVSRLRSIEIPIKVQEIPSSVLQILRELGKKSEKQTETIDLTTIGKKLNDTLFPFQKESICYGIRNNGRLLIADDMGLGKTIQAISLATYYRSDWPVLVVTPSSVKVAWAREFEKWVSPLENFEINIVHTGKDDPSCGLINILSYDLLPKHLKKLKEQNFKVIIADESHFIKNSKAARTKAAMQLLKRASRVILLSGTPALSRPEELYTQVCAVNPRVFPSFHGYARRYCDAKQNRFGWDYSGSSNLEELRIILENKVMIRKQLMRPRVLATAMTYLFCFFRGRSLPLRRLKNDMLHQLPEKQRQIVILDPSDVNTRFVSSEAKKLETSTGENNRGAVFQMDKRCALLEYFSATCEAKKKAVKEYIKDLLEGGRKFILFAHHQLMLNSISEMLVKKNISFIRVDGSTSANARQELVEKFQKEPDCLVAVLSITAANTGLNLTSATTVIFAELYWNPGALVQAEDRVYRIGQKNAVTIIYLLAENTADDAIWPLVQGKLEVLTSAGLNQDEFSPEVTKFEDPKQKRMFDYFHALMDDEDDLLKYVEEEEPPEKRVKTDNS